MVLQTMEDVIEKRKEAIIILNEMKNKINEKFKYPGLVNKKIRSKWYSEIEALDMGIEQLQLAIDNQ